MSQPTEYAATQWQDAPSTATPLKAALLNKLEQGVKATSQVAIAALALGNAATTPTVFAQTTPAATWSISHSLGRLPLVHLYVDGVQVEADVAVTASAISVSFPMPTAGFVLYV